MCDTNERLIGVICVQLSFNQISAFCYDVGLVENAFARSADIGPGGALKTLKPQQIRKMFQESQYAVDALGVRQALNRAVNSNTNNADDLKDAEAGDGARDPMSDAITTLRAFYAVACIAASRGGIGSGAIDDTPKSTNAAISLNFLEFIHFTVRLAKKIFLKGLANPKDRESFLLKPSYGGLTQTIIDLEDDDGVDGGKAWE